MQSSDSHKTRRNPALSVLIDQELSSEYVAVEKRHFLPPVLRLLRVQQWVKNLLVFVPVLTSHRLFNNGIFLHAVLTFAAMCCCASGTYVVNDLLDTEADRQHPTKRRRPLAASEMKRSSAAVLATALFLVGLLISHFWLPSAANTFIYIYVGTTLAYSTLLKPIVLLDVFILTSLYSLRVEIGGAATSIRVSEWTTAFFMFLFLSLALLKRFIELSRLTAEVGGAFLLRRDYRKGDQAFVQQAGVASGLIAVLVFALYINSPDVHALYRYPARLWLLCPVLGFGVLYLWMLGERQEISDDPVIAAVTNPTILLLVAAGLLIVVASAL